MSIFDRFKEEDTAVCREVPWVDEVVAELWELARRMARMEEIQGFFVG